jgi:hypothetical protein
MKSAVAIALLLMATPAITAEITRDGNVVTIKGDIW